jgi:hypothetical protein
MIGVVFIRAPDHCPPISGVTFDSFQRQAITGSEHALSCITACYPFQRIVRIDIRTAPVAVGNSSARAVISRVLPDKQLVTLLTVCTGSDGRVICEGRALEYVGDVAG